MRMLSDLLPYGEVVNNWFTVDVWCEVTRAPYIVKMNMNKIMIIPKNCPEDVQVFQGLPEPKLCEIECFPAGLLHQRGRVLVSGTLYSLFVDVEFVNGEMEVYWNRGWQGSVLIHWFKRKEV